MRIASLLCALVLASVSGLAWGASTEFTYQGQLRSATLPANGSFDFTFALFDAVTAGNQVGSTITANATTLTNGLFTVPLDFGSSAFPGADRWLEISVQATGGGAGFTTLTPRQKLTAAPYALALPFLRTVSSQNGPSFQSANVIGGSTANAIASGITGVVIAGGGATNGFPQLINASYSCIGGGYSNTISANGSQSVIAGGVGNTVNSSNATIGGGQSNTVSGASGTVGGGQSNTASGASSLVPGGNSNTASGSTSFAAGNRAKASNNGAFVWGDSTNADVTSTVADQFVVRANGGVVVNTTADVNLNATNGVTLSVAGGSGASVPIGTLYKDNTVVAWGRVLASALDTNFNVKSFVRNSAGNYTITLFPSFSQPDTLIPTVTVSYTTVQPTTAAAIRIASINQGISSNSFNVYINSGTFTAADADFTFTVTGR